MIRITIITLLVSVLIHSNIGDFMSDYLSTRSAAMGNVNTILISESANVSGNPALLGNLTRNHFQTVYSYTPSLDYQKGALYISKRLFGNGTFALGIKSGIINNIKHTSFNIGTNRPEIINLFNDKTYILYGGWGKTIYKGLNVGMNIKFATESIFNETARYFNSNIGLTYRITKQFHFGFALYDYLPAKIYWTINNRIEQIPRSIVISGGASLYNKRLIAIAEFYIDSLGNYRSNGGFEWTANKYTKLRLGLYNKDITCGIGITYRNININYSFRINELSNMQSLGLQIEFGKIIRLEDRLLEGLDLSHERNIREINYLDKIDIIKKKIRDIFSIDAVNLSTNESNYLNQAELSLQSGNIPEAKMYYSKIKNIDKKRLESLLNSIEK